MRPCTATTRDAWIEELGEHVDAAAYGAAGWHALMDRLTDALPGANVAFVRQPFNANGSTLGCFSGFAPEFMASFDRHYSGINPFTPIMAALRPGEVVVANTYLPIRTYARTEFVADWLAPQSSLNAANVKLSGTPDSVAWISIHYDDARAPAYDEIAGDLLRHLRPRLTRALATADRLAIQSEAALQEATLLGNEAEIALVIDERGRIAAANAEAQRALERGDVLRAGRRGLVVTCPQTDDWLRNQLGGASDHHETALTITGRALILHLAPLPTFVVDNWPSSLAIGRKFLLLVRADRPADARWRLTSFARRHRLSPAEARMCERLLAGDSLAAAAETLGITRSTSRDRLKTIFAKAGVSRQSELILRMVDP